MSVALNTSPQIMDIYIILKIFFSPLYSPLQELPYASLSQRPPLTSRAPQSPTSPVTTDQLSIAADSTALSRISI